MNLTKVLAELRAERDRINEAIQTLERLASTRPGPTPGAIRQRRYYLRKHPEKALVN